LVLIQELYYDEGPTKSQDQYTFFFIISRLILLRMKTASGKICRENQNTHFVFKNISFPPPRKSHRLCDNMEKYCTDGQSTDDNMAHAHCVILIAFPLQQWLHERTSTLSVLLYSALRVDKCILS
jgi:hypothetical protein